MASQLNKTDVDVKFNQSLTILDRNDPVEGGLAGIDNKPHIELYQNQLWLKQQIESLEKRIDGVEVAPTPTPSPAPTPSPVPTPSPTPVDYGFPVIDATDGSSFGIGDKPILRILIAENIPLANHKCEVRASHRYYVAGSVGYGENTADIFVDQKVLTTDENGVVYFKLPSIPTPSDYDQDYSLRTVLVVVDYQTPIAADGSSSFKSNSIEYALGYVVTGGYVNPVFAVE